MIRLFVALPVAGDMGRMLAACPHGLTGARWVPPENFHLTLRFVGAVEGGHAQDLHDALGRITAPAFQVAAQGYDWFGGKRKPSSLILAIEKADALLHLQRKVESALVRAGCAPSPRKFRPHITLARLKQVGFDDLARYCRDHPAQLPLTLHAGHFALYSSVLTSDGPIYRREAEYPLE